MIRRWGAVLMAAAGLTVAVGTPAAASSNVPRTRHHTTSGRPNQTITFARTPDLAGPVIRVTARGPINGFGTARVVDFAADEATGGFRGIWDLAFGADTIRYQFRGVARDQRPGPSTPAEITGSTGLLMPLGGVQQAARDLPQRYDALVAGDFRLLAGTGRLAGIGGSGTFHGFTMPAEVTPTLPASD
ncbi:hypothetical protein [Actinocatenispora sera]|uniref:Uncharacterized protein n=1 Tax=Actinocatenispora sera TaxID=390989 RepID=A0A810L332_9ACTN|nr:hypothetical protein [Actinocatenispora sera]BCJ29315.1 hypothetical protein Asera_34230 [Actinocatenispora sera]